MAFSPLAGTKVLEMASGVAASYCGKLLSDLGADVVKIESPAGGDAARSRGPFPDDVPHPERSASFLYLNTGKKSITLDIYSSDGEILFADLVRAFGADLLIEDFLPEQRQALAWKYERVTSLRRKMVMVSITPFGLTGPCSNYKAVPLTTFHAGGEGYLLPGSEGWRLYPDREPLKWGGIASEMVCGLSAAVGALAALFEQRVSGRGQHLDVSKQEALFSLNRIEMSRYPNEQFIESRATRNLPVGGLVECKNGFVVIMPLEPHMWDALVEAMGRPAWTQEEIFRDPTSLLSHGEEATAMVAGWAKEHTKEEIYHNLQRNGCAVGIVSSAADLFASEQLGSRNFFIPVDHPLAGLLEYPSVPYRFSDTECEVRRAPLLGEHNQEIYVGLMGIAPADCVRLRTLGVI